MSKSFPHQGKSIGVLRHTHYKQYEFFNNNRIKLGTQRGASNFSDLNME